MPISLAEVTEAVKKILCGMVPSVDESRPEMLKDLDIVGLSWLTCIFMGTGGCTPIIGVSHCSASPGHLYQ